MPAKSGKRLPGLPQSIAFANFVLRSIENDLSRCPNLSQRFFSAPIRGDAPPLCGTNMAHMIQHDLTCLYPGTNAFTPKALPPEFLVPNVPKK